MGSESALAVKETRSFLRGFGMNDRFGPVLGAFARRYLDDIPYPEEDAERVRELAERGTVVYVHRSRNVADYLALASAVYRNRLPVARFVGGLNVAAMQPWWRFPRTRHVDPERRGELSPDEWRLRACVAAGSSAMLFLKRPLTLITASTAHPSKFIEQLVEMARAQERPIFLVPHFLALRSEPGTFEPTAADAIFGTAEEPGLLRAMARLMLSRGIARWEVSEAIDLTTFVRDHAEQSTEKLTKKVRWSILHHLARTERLAHGPPLKNFARLREETFRDAILQRQVGEIAQAGERSEEQLWHEARVMYDEIASRPDFDLARLADKIARRIWPLIYDGIHIDRRDIDRMRQASRDGPVVLCPSHRSHIDYVMISQTFLWYGLLPPMGAAGINLNIFLVGPLMRRMGAFFIRRSFKGDKLYASTFKAYVRRLFKEGFTIEFYLEGGRSRTGKTLPPKLGFLGMLVEAYVEGRQPDAIFVPAHISYEKLIESASYMHELTGGEKEKETTTGLLRALQKILQSRYGRVFITFDRPVSIRAFLEEHGVTREELRGASGEARRRHVTQQLAYRLVFGINNAVVVTANALAIVALFGYRRRGLDADLLGETVDIAMRHIRRVSGDTARFATGLLTEPDRALELALERLEQDELVRRETAAERTYFKVADDAWLQLDFYKNNVIHFFVPEAIVATAMRSLRVVPGKPVELPLVRERALLLSRLFKFEFIFEEGDFDELLGRTIDRGVDYGVLERLESGDLALRSEPEALRFGAFCANLLATFVESYCSALGHLAEATGKATTRKALVLRLLEQTRGDFLSGAITCPEAVSKANIENAVLLAEDQQLLSCPADGQPTLLTGSEERLAELLEVLQRARLGS